MSSRKYTCVPSMRLQVYRWNADETSFVNDFIRRVTLYTVNQTVFKGSTCFSCFQFHVTRPSPFPIRLASFENGNSTKTFVDTNIREFAACGKKGEFVRRLGVHFSSTRTLRTENSCWEWRKMSLKCTSPSKCISACSVYFDRRMCVLLVSIPFEHSQLCSVGDPGTSKTGG